MSASQELEKSATNFALEAVRLDKQGAKGMAITTYQKAIESWPRGSSSAATRSATCSYDCRLW